MPNKKGFLSRAPFPVVLPAPAAAGNVPIILGGTDSYEVLGVDILYDVVGGAGATLDLVAIPKATLTASGIAGTGVSTLASTVDLTANARTVQHKSGAGPQSKRIVPAGGALVMRTAGTLTGLAGMAAVVWLQSVQGHRSM